MGHLFMVKYSNELNTQSFHTQKNIFRTIYFTLNGLIGTWSYFRIGRQNKYIIINPRNFPTTGII